jgi:amino acid transporter
MIDVSRLLFGRRLANAEGRARRLGVPEGISAMGLDALASTAYGPEAALTLLIPLGAAGLHLIRPLMAAVLLLLVLLYLSYRQTIAAYPNNGGSYVVAKDNIGPNAGLLAGSALMIDYVLNVAVGISAGVAALTSAVPMLHPYTLELCLAILALLTIVNLRGTLEAGIALSVPTCLFVATFGGLLLFGAAKAVLSGGSPAAIVAPPRVGTATEGAALWLLLRAFASGCTAMTGVEAVSNGVGAFREPTVRCAHRTLMGIVLVLTLLLGLVSYLVPVYGIAAMDQTRPDYQTVLSQLAGAIAGRGVVYFIAIGSLLTVLCLSANTSFVDFPRLCRLVSADGYLPRAFATPGRRLVYSFGIVWLAGCAGLLLTVFGGITDRLIPLFAVGAFTAFTLSQFGMAGHWRRQGGSRLRLVINGTGAAGTAAALAVIIAAKFTAGAWVTVLVVPCVIVLLKTIKRYYGAVDRRLRGAGPIELGRLKRPIAIVPLRRWDRLAEKALQYSLLLSRDIIAVHLTRLDDADHAGRERELRRKWRLDVEEPARKGGRKPPELVLSPSPYRSFVGHLLRQVSEVEAAHPDRPIVVVIPQIVREHWWDYLLLGGSRAARLRDVLLRHGGANLAVAIVPWTREPPHPEEVIEREEPGLAPPAPASGPDPGR